MVANLSIGPATLLYSDAQMPFIIDGSFSTMRRDATTHYYFHSYTDRLIKYYGPPTAPLQTYVSTNIWPAGWNMQGWDGVPWVYNLYEIDATHWIAFCHVENAYPGSYRIGIAYTADAAQTWTYCGHILKPQSNNTTNSINNIGGAPYLTIGGYFYVYFNDMDSATDGKRITVARALITDVVTAAQSGTVGAWMKYASGSWNQPGLSGVGSNIIADAIYGYWDMHSDAAYCPALGKYLLLVPTLQYGQLLLYTSTDGVTWGERTTVDEISPNPNTYMEVYPCFVGLSGATNDCREVGSTFWIIYPHKGTGANYSYDELYVRELTVSGVSLNAHLLPGGWTKIQQVAVRELGTTLADGSGNHNLYHIRPVWNSDSSYLILVHHGPGTTWTVSLHHGLTGVWIKDLFTLATYGWRLVWSKVYPHLLYTDQSGTNNIVVYNVETKSVVQTVASPTTPMTPSGPTINYAGTRIMWSGGSSVSATRIMSYDLNTDGTINVGSLASWNPTWPANTLSYHTDKWRYCNDGDRIILPSHQPSHSGTAMTGSTTMVIRLDTTNPGNLPDETAGVYVPNTIYFINPPLLAEERQITAYSGAPNYEATLNTPLPASPVGVGYDMTNGNGAINVWSDTGTLVYRHIGQSAGHFHHAGGKLALPIVGTGKNLSVSVLSTDGSTPKLVVYYSPWASAKPSRIQNFHTTWPSNDPARFFIGFFPYYSYYPYPGTYLPNVSTAWDGPLGEANAYVPYDELVEVRTLDNWATQANIRIRYLCRTLTRGDTAGESFWTQPQPSVHKTGTRIVFHSRNIP